VQSTRIESTVHANRDPVVVLAADEKFAMPLAVTVRSALENLRPDRKLHVFVLDGGIKDATKVRVEKSWPNGRYEIHWVAVDSSVVKKLPMSGAKHVNHVCYYRILMPWLLPHVQRAIHLDADMLICADLSRLWDHDMGGQLCWAVQDCAAPYMDAQVALTNFDCCRAYLESAEPVPNYRELKLDPRAPYFNAGLLYLDFAAWRDADLPGQLLECLEQNRQHVKWNDQYALNVGIKARTFSAILLGLKARLIARALRSCVTIRISFTSPHAINRGWFRVRIHHENFSTSISIEPRGPAGVRPRSAICERPTIASGHIRDAFDKLASGCRAERLTGCITTVAWLRVNARTIQSSDNSRIVATVVSSRRSGRE
jgi:hypothetical protein